MVAKHNPLKITSLANLKQPGVRYVNRSIGAGTRMLLDEIFASRTVKRRLATHAEPSAGLQR